MKVKIILSFITLSILLCSFIFIISCKSDSKSVAFDSPKRTILIIFDGLPLGAIEKLPLPNLQQLAEKGCYHKAVHVSLPAHPKRNDEKTEPCYYPWGCSLPNPVAMSGTIFIGQPNIKNHLIQHSFQDKPTAFVVDGGAYEEISGGYTVYDQLQKTYQDLFKDELPINRAKEIIADLNPAFIRIHLQGPGSAGYTVYAGPDTPHEGHLKYAASDGSLPWHKNIWHPKSPFALQSLYADSLIGDFVDWLTDNELMDETVIFIMGDHGQTDEGWHDPYNEQSNKTPLIVLGKGIKQGKVFDYAEVIDIAPTIAFVADVEKPTFALGRVLKELFIGESDQASANRYLEKLNNLLITHHEFIAKQPELLTNDQFNEENNKFLTIETIGVWHQKFTDLKALVNHNEQVLIRLEALKPS